MVSKFFKKIFFVFTFLTISFSINLFFQTESKAVGCEKNAGRIVITEVGRDQTGDGQTYTDGDTVLAPFRYADGHTDSEFSTRFSTNCQQEPEEYRLIFYDFYICRLDPYKNDASPDLSSCLSIFSNTAGKSVTIKPGVDVKLLDGAIQIEAGIYPYAAVIVNNKIDLKHKQEYVVILTNGNEAVPDLLGSGDAASKTGQMWCYSQAIITAYDSNAAIVRDGDDAEDYAAAHFKADPISENSLTTNVNSRVDSSAPGTDTARLDCGTSEPAAGDYEFATEIINILGDADNPYNYPASGYEDEGTAISGVRMAANLLQDDNLTIATTVFNATRIGAYFQYSSPININERTIGLKLNFKTSSAVSIDFGQQDNTAKDIWAIKMGADPFTVQIQTKERRGRRGSTGDWR